ncbi:hypothetical protein HZA97_03100 [Candidatus Woesearchaeota archaeon]|nr:hypothetical protein [Candidatus Woesearchaeota archaeon]
MFFFVVLIIVIFGISKAFEEHFKEQTGTNSVATNSLKKGTEGFKNLAELAQIALQIEEDVGDLPKSPVKK